MSDQPQSVAARSVAGALLVLGLLLGLFASLLYGAVLVVAAVVLAVLSWRR